MRERPFTDADETGIAGGYFDVSIAIKDSFDPFGFDAALGAAEPSVGGRPPLPPLASAEEEKR
jgi:hypothetical protein